MPRLRARHVEPGSGRTRRLQRLQRRRLVTSTTEHDTSVDMVAGKWVAWCAICGQVGLGEDFEGDALAIAERHREVRGFERPR